jgi:hypothetical protein
MMKRIGMVLLAAVVMLGVMGSWAMAQYPSSPDYKAQLEAALGGAIVGVQRTTKLPSSSLTQVVNFTVNRGGGRTEVVPVEVVIVKSGTGYVVQSMYIVRTSAAMATQRATQLPAPSAETMGGGGGGGGTGTTTTRTPSASDECKKKCFTNPTSGPIDWAKAQACYWACMLGVPNLFK